MEQCIESGRRVLAPFHLCHLPSTSETPQNHYWGVLGTQAERGMISHYNDVIKQFTDLQSNAPSHTMHNSQLVLSTTVLNI